MSPRIGGNAPRAAFWKWLRVLLLFGLSLAVVAVTVALYLLYPLRPVGGDSAADIEIQSGATAIQISRQLESAGLIRDAQAFRRWIWLTGNTRRLRAGWYHLSPELSGQAILTALVQGDVLHDTFVIPEGCTVERIASVWEQRAFGTQQEFLDACRQAQEKLGYSVEGYLFPDTYSLVRGTTAQMCVRIMLRRLDEQWRKLEGSVAGDLTKHAAITLASIVEREARVAEERPLIAGVFHNRLRLGWKLQADPTVAYLLGYPSRRLLYRDLEVDSPYNTYRFAGLPPGPICSPGFAALQAACSPAQTDKMYFVARGDGTHAFSRTLAEHNRVRREIRASVSSQ